MQFALKNLNHFQMADSSVNTGCYSAPNTKKG